DELGECVPVRAQVVDDLGEPLVAVRVDGGGGAGPEQPDRVASVDGVRREGGGGGVVGQDHLAALEARDVPPLRGGHGGDRVLRRALVEGGVRDVGDVVEDERRVDLVR